MNVLERVIEMKVFINDMHCGFRPGRGKGMLKIQERYLEEKIFALAIDMRVMRRTYCMRYSHNRISILKVLQVAAK